MTGVGRREGLRWFGAGLLAFGIVLGLTTGMSGAEGISVTLVSSLLTFVGGSVLGFAGFHRSVKKAGSEPQIDLHSVGIALVMFSVGVAIGLGLGVGIKLQAGRVGVSLLQADESTVCEDVKGRRGRDEYQRPEGAARDGRDLAVEDLDRLARDCCD